MGDGTRTDGRGHGDSDGGDYYGGGCGDSESDQTGLGAWNGGYSQCGSGTFGTGGNT